MALTDKLNAIGNAIRAKTGKTEKLTLAEMPSEIASIETGGVAEDLNDVLTEQEELIATLRDTLNGKASGGGTIETWTFTMEDGSEITKEVVIV